MTIINKICGILMEMEPAIREGFVTLMIIIVAILIFSFGINVGKFMNSIGIF